MFSDLASFSGTRTPSVGSVNSAGGTNRVSKISVGVYDAAFGGLASAAAGNVQVTAGAANRYCKPASWHPSGTTDLSVDVRCFDNAGNPADSPFFVTIQDIVRMCQGTSYLWSDRTTGVFEPSNRFSHSQSLGFNTVERTAPGRYRATLPGIPGSGGHAQVSAYGPDTARCQIVSWGLAARNAIVDVACFNSDGSPMDTRFSLQFSNQDVIGRINTAALENAGIYLWADQPEASAPYTPSNTFRFSQREGVIIFEPPSIMHLSTGRYRAVLPSYAPEVDQAGVQLSSYGVVDRTCSVVGVSASGTDAQVDVACTNAAGDAADSRWTLMFSTNAVVPF